LPDAYDVAAALRLLQFDEVELKTNLTSQEMANAFETFSRNVVRTGDLAVVYYSGHGGQAGGESYLLPVDYPARGAYPITRVRDLLDGSAASARAMIFDACRGELIVDSLEPQVGLRAIEGKPGTLIAYSAPPRSIAPFDQERHSAYTAELLEMLRSPERDFKAMLEEVQLRMYRMTKGRQMPYLNGSFDAPLYLGFIPDPKAGKEERISWESAEKVDSSAGYHTYLRWYPNGVFSDLARMRLSATQSKVGLTPGDTKVNPKDGEQYAWIPSGNYRMDCIGNDDLCRPAERPAVNVTFARGFRIGVTEATVGAWKRYRRATGAAALPTKDPDGRAKLNEAAENDLMPALAMNRDAARSFCGWIGGRLPKEEEWEYAARAGVVGFDPGWQDAAWYAGNSGLRWLNSSQVKSVTPAVYNAQMYGNGDGPHQVAQKRPNAWGLYDTLGNLWEWAESRAPDAKLGVLRGGSWASTEYDMFLSKRIEIDPAIERNDIGFRCLWEWE
jgi:formylglycine-generating enzyme required for sulfatase activity